MIKENEKMLQKRLRHIFIPSADAVYLTYDPGFRREGLCNIIHPDPHLRTTFRGSPRDFREHGDIATNGTFYLIYALNLFQESMAMCLSQRSGPRALDSSDFMVLVILAKVKMQLMPFDAELLIIIGKCLELHYI